ncbi:MAG: nicotinate-nucleotide--dimethylbenzimidazole phosphoribosyltransferase [Treponema sp.]|nr:MAG: nicotinate-nucleotide--dimethylbenzimidazole phosphoribosyltransferase [Treponema sp.]
MQVQKIVDNTLKMISPASFDIAIEMQTLWDKLAHPPGSLGEMELMTVKLASIQNTVKPSAEKKAVVVFAADNGVFEEGVTSQPQITTFLIAESMVNSKTGLGVISKFAKNEIFVYDVGLIKTSTNSKIINKKLREATNNIAKEPAMSREECLKLISIGIDVAQNMSQEGYKLVGAGELGICNTTTTAAVLSAVADVSPTVTVGKGASTTKAMREKKIKAVEKAIKINSPDANDPIDCIAKVGGFDIAAMCGFYIGCAAYKLPCVIDGYISTVAALCAIKLNPICKDYFFASHSSAEQGAVIASELTGLSPVLNMKMRLGEGTGCPLLFNLIDASLFTFYNMGKFSDTKIDENDLIDLRN